jgi:hypothetical protein
MTRDEVIAMARESFMYSSEGDGFFAFSFAELTRAFEAVAAHESEACARQCRKIMMSVIYDIDSYDEFDNGKVEGVLECELSIISRSQGWVSHET